MVLRACYYSPFLFDMNLFLMSSDIVFAFENKASINTLLDICRSYVCFCRPSYHHFVTMHKQS